MSRERNRSFPGYRITGNEQEENSVDDTADPPQTIEREPPRTRREWTRPEENRTDFKQCRFGLAHRELTDLWLTDGEDAAHAQALSSRLADKSSQPIKSATIQRRQRGDIVKLAR